MLRGEKSINKTIKQVDIVFHHVKANEQIVCKHLWRFSGEESTEHSDISKILKIELKNHI